MSETAPSAVSTGLRRATAPISETACFRRSIDSRAPRHPNARTRKRVELPLVVGSVAHVKLVVHCDKNGRRPKQIAANGRLVSYGLE
jgi:hypothetical protein